MMTEEKYNVEQSIKAFETVKYTAKNLDDVKAWFISNISTLEIPAGIEVKEIVVNLNYVELFDVFYDECPGDDMQMRVLVKSYLPEKPLPGFMAKLSATGKSEQTRSDHWRFPIQMDEWSFIVASLTFTYLRGQQWESNSHAARKLESFLETQLPKHFPGISIENLRALHETGLLTVHAQEDVVGLLYNARLTADTEKELPIDITEPHSA